MNMRRRFSQINFSRRSSRVEPVHNPVLTPEDEAFFQSLIAKLDSGDPAPLPDGNLSTISPVSDDALNTPLPPSPTGEMSEDAVKDEKAPEGKLVSELSTSEVPARPEKKRRPWNRIRRLSSVMRKDGNSPNLKSSRKSSGVNARPSIADDNDMSDVLERLNLSADSGSVFSVNEETQELLRKFKLIFKDLVNGVPTAYHDLEMLLTNGDKWLQRSYSQLPGFIQRLIKKLPETLAKNFGLEALAAASLDAGSTAASETGFSPPALKEIVGNPAAIVGILRSIMAFLRTKFPAVMGMNVLWSLALFILLFVLWYCHKRGREVRLDNERLAAEAEAEKINDEGEADKVRAPETLATTAGPDASAEDAREDVKEAQQAQEVAPAKAEQERKENRQSVGPLMRSQSKLAIWSRPKREPTINIASYIEPYPGT